MANFVTDVVERKAPDGLALVAIDAAGARREWTFGEIAAATRAVSAQLAARGVGRGDVVATMCGSRIEWVVTLLACLRMGAVAAPYSPMLRPADLATRAAAARPTLVVADPAHVDTLAAADLTDVVTVAQLDLDAEPGDAVPPAPDLDPTDRAFLLFTSGSTGTPKPVWHAVRYVEGQRLQAEHWLGVRPGDVVWSTGAPGWSKSTRNTFIAPWLCGASAVLHEGRFDPEERMAILRDEQVTVLCMAPTEWRRIVQAGAHAVAAPSLRRLVAAGEPLDAPTIAAWHDATRLTIADGYGQTETGHMAAATVEVPAPPGSVGRPLPGVVSRLVDGALEVDAATVPTLSLVDESDLVDGRWWRTGDLFDQDDDGFLYFRSRADDVILSSGYRIDPVEVEKALRTHPAVRDCIVAGVADPTRGEIVAALVVAAEGADAEETAEAERTASLQAHVRDVTAPYKYPRLVVYTDALPLTPTGKPARGRGRELLAQARAAPPRP